MTLLLRVIIFAIVFLSILLVISLLLRKQLAPRWLTLGYPPLNPRSPLLPSANRGALQVSLTADWRAEDVQRRLGEQRAADGRLLAEFGTEYNMPKWVHAALLEEMAQVGFDVSVAGAGDASRGAPLLHTELIDARVRPAEGDALLVLSARLLDPDGRECLAERYEETAEPHGRRPTEEAWANALERALQKAAQMVAFDAVARLPAPQDDEPAG